MLTDLLLGLTTALRPENFLYCLVGVTIGTVAGIIPGLSSLVTMSLLLPLTYHLDPTAGLIMLGGIFYGTTYGGSTAAILLNLPGTPNTAVTCLDGHPMARNGRAGVALFMTTIASFVGASVGITLMILFSPAFVKMAIYFGPAEYFSLMALGLVAASSLSGDSATKGVGMVCIGIVLGLVGIDGTSGARRFTFGLLELYDGVSLVALAMGLFGVSQVIDSARNQAGMKLDQAISLRSLMPTRRDLRQSVAPMIRGASIGSFLGVLPGVGGTIASFMAYAAERKVSRTPERFGKGAIEGIVAPETANNAAEQTAFIPTLTLGIPGSASMALLIGVLMVHGITPGPKLVSSEPELFWGLVMSFWVGNILLLILNIPFIGIWVRILTVPYYILYPAITMFVCIGTYSVRYNIFDVYAVVFFGLLGYVARVLHMPAAPLLLGFVLGPMMEAHFKRALVLSRGDLTVFFTQPLSMLFLVVSLGILVIGVLRVRRVSKRAA